MARRRRSLTADELATIAAFVVSERQERVRLVLARGEVNDSDWAHNPPLRESAMWQLPSGWSADDLLAELRRRGASATATGIIGQLAGQTLPLDQAVRTVFAAWYGDLLSLVPGRLAYYDGEWKNARYLLVAKTSNSAHPQA